MVHTCFNFLDFPLLLHVWIESAGGGEIQLTFFLWNSRTIFWRVQSVKSHTVKSELVREKVDVGLETIFSSGWKYFSHIQLCDERQSYSHFADANLKLKQNKFVKFRQDP